MYKCRLQDEELLIYRNCKHYSASDTSKNKNMLSLTLTHIFRVQCELPSLFQISRAKWAKISSGPDKTNGDKQCWRKVQVHYEGQLKLFI